MATERYSIRVDGKVQGVWFRKSTADKATSLGLTGVVRNEAGGSVYIEAEGEPEALTALVTWCFSGPEHAHVQGVTILKVPVVGYRSFEIVE